MLCSFIGQANANVINVEDVTIPQGEQQEIKVLYSLDKADAYVGYAFKLIMPTGIATVKDSGGYPVYALDENNTGFNMNVTSSDGFGALPKNASVTINGTEGTLLTLTLQADASLEVGSTHVVSISSIMLTEKVDDTQKSVYLEDATFTVTIGEPTDKHIILDETSTTVPEAAEDVDVRVYRTIKAGEWSTICLPFAMTEEQVKKAFGNDVELGTFTGCEATEDGEGNVTALKVNFGNSVIIEANHPYIIKISADVTQFEVDGVDIIPEENPSVDMDELRYKVGSKWYTEYNSFIGTYVANTVIPDLAMFLSGNKFWYSKGLTKTKAFRGYFSFYNILADVVGAEARVSMSFNDVVTSINAAPNEKGGMINENVICDLQGRRVSNSQFLIHHSQLKKGIYIKNGKKVIK